MNAPEPTLQELVFGADHDYRAVSPHLKHRELYESLLSRVRSAVAETTAAGLRPALLEVGAGSGGFVEPALAYGYDVTATEMSRPAVAALEDRYGDNPRFRAIFDQDGSLTCLGEERYSVLLFASVLHHIPDYIAVIDAAIQHLEPGGALVSFQDPMWYPTRPRAVRRLDGAAFLAWRLGQGEYRRGFETRMRRLRGVYDDSRPSDMVEYHVVRDGVNQEAILTFLSTRFTKVQLMPYWSALSAPWQRLGRRFGITNTFGILASGYQSPSR